MGEKIKTLIKLLSTGIDFRKDGKLLRNIDPMRTIMPYLFRNRNGSIVYAPTLVDFNTARDFIRSVNNENPGLRMGTFEVVIAALVRTICKYPYLNRFVAGKKLYARNHIAVSFVVLKLIDGEYKETNAKIYFDFNDTLYDITKKINSNIELCQSNKEKNDDKLMEFVSKLPSPIISFITFSLRKLNDFGLLPMSLIKTDPLYSSVYISNLGSIGQDSIHHHLYEWGTTSVFITMGKLIRVNELMKNGEMKNKIKLNLTFSIDERIADGIYLAKALRYFTSLIDNPKLLELPPKEVLEDDEV